MIHVYTLALLFLVNPSSSAGSSSDTRTPLERATEGQEAVQIRAEIQSQAGILTLPDTPFYKIADDVFCDDHEKEKGAASFHGAPLTSGKVASFTECKNQCLNDPKCRYMAYWRSKKCETYVVCYKRSRDGSQKIGVYKKVSPCEGIRDHYQDLMASEFPGDVVRPIHFPFEWDEYEGHPAPLSKFQNPNFLCHCTGQVWMTCAVFLSAADQATEVRAISERLSAGDPEKMKPFRFMSNAMYQYGGEYRFITFSTVPQGVIAELNLPEHAVDLDYTTAGCITMKHCAEFSPTCPIQRRPFISGEPVYIFRDSFPGYTIPGKEKPIVCISVKGLRSYVMTQKTKPGDGFRDPLGRSRLPYDEEKRDLVSIQNDYLMFFVFDEVAIATGICETTRIEGVSPDRPDSGAGPSSGPDLSVEEQMQQMGLDDSAGPESKSKKKKKKKKSGSGASAAGPSGDLDDGSKSQPSSGSPDLPPTAQAGPSSLPEPLFPGSPQLLPHSGSPHSDPDTKMKVVLSDSDIAKMRRSFAEAQARRAAKRREEEQAEQRVASQSQNINRIPTIFWGLFILAISCTVFTINHYCFSTLRKSELQLEFSP